MKRIIFISFFLISTSLIANPNSVINLDAHFDAQNKLVTPDKLLLAKALKFYKDGYHKSALTNFKLSAAFGNSEAQKYTGLMYIKSLGTSQDWATGYAWIKLAALDETAQHTQLRDGLYTKMKPQEIQQSDIIYQRLLKDYSTNATMKRRARWVRKQKQKATGSRVGSRTVNVQSQYINGVKADNNRTGRIGEMEAFVSHYNFGIIN